MITKHTTHQGVLVHPWMDEPLRPLFACSTSMCPVTCKFRLNNHALPMVCSTRHRFIPV